MVERVFRDPVHGLIEFKGADAVLAPILDTRAFQRLRRIHAMGFAWTVYPGAEHSRFGHSLGAFAIANQVIEKLQLNEQVGLHIRVAALLHDIGHGPFSHAWEHAVPSVSHEEWGSRIVLENEELRQVLESIEPGLSSVLKQFWDKTYRPLFARKLVSSQLDVDRMDYLLRDGHYSGVGYATFDLVWILYALQVREIHSKDDSRDLVIDYRRGMYAVEQYLFARSYMYAQVYHHKTVRAAEWLFVKLMKRHQFLVQNNGPVESPPFLQALASDETITISDYMKLTDDRILVLTEDWSESAQDPVLRDLATRLVHRKYFKTIELGNNQESAKEQYEQAIPIAQKQFGDQWEFYLALDNVSQTGYSTEHGEELHVIGHPDHELVSLGDLMTSMPIDERASRLRLVCAPEIREKLSAG